tara:strand:+ start:347 stop:520 length:174 start_codon:yes stop_codon:yes gene_type:complete
VPDTPWSSPEANVSLTPDSCLALAAARFSPDDKFSKQRLICKKRFGLLPMQNPQAQL